MSANTETPEEIAARHKKELKSFDGERRAGVKNAKSRGKKAKGAAKEVEFKYQGLERDLKERHRLELEQLTSGDGDVVGDGDGDEDAKEKAAGAVDDNDKAAPVKGEDASRPAPSTAPSASEAPPTTDETEAAKRQKAIQKKLHKKHARRQKERDRDTRIEEEQAGAGPSRRQLELEALRTLYLQPRKLDVQEVGADGHCLYRAVGMQCRRLGLAAGDVTGDPCHVAMRALCADVLLGSTRGEYEPFAECGAGHVGAENGGGHPPATYEDYVRHVRASATWGGQLELRALSEGLRCPIVVFSADGPPLTMGAEYSAEGEGGEDHDWGRKKALLLSFHRHYYALGEHYNSVVPK